MRPVAPGAAPQTYAKYQDAIGDLEDRLGIYCSYCERRLPCSLEVEHVSPKNHDPALLTTWENFLLACKTCNTVKGQKLTDKANFLWPTDDNTLLAIHYLDGGFVVANSALPVVKTQAEKLIDLVGLDRHGATTHNLPTERDRRWMQREQCLTTARLVRERVDKAPPDYHANAIELAVIAAVSEGFFSCWLSVFQDIPEFCNQLIAKMPGTSTDCFDPSGRPISRPGGRC